MLVDNWFISEDTMTKDIFVFIEQRGGVVLPAAMQAITAATQLAGKTGGKVVTGIIGHNTGAVADKLDGTGIATTFVADADALANYNALKYSRILAGMIQKADPQVVLLAASFMGRDIAPRVAVRLGAGLATDCTELEIEGSGAWSFAGRSTTARHRRAFTSRQRNCK